MSRYSAWVLPALAALMAVVVPAQETGRTTSRPTSKAASTPTRAQAQSRIQVRVDPRVELMSILFRLAGSQEYNKGRVDRYTKDVEAHFAGFKEHAAVKAARSMRRWRGVGYDSVMNMAVHFKDTKDLAEVVPFEPRPKTLERRWTVMGARGFLREARKFVKDTKFADFVDAQKELYATAVTRMQAVLDENARLAWFDSFFGARPAAEFKLALGMLNGGACYGVSVRRPDGKEELHCVLGVWSTDDEGLPKFQKAMVATVVHEFCHSYCNALVDKHADKLAAAGKKLFPHVENAMRQQAYASWKTMMYESVVRACVVRYLLANNGPGVARTQVASDISRSFLWVGELSKLLEKYEGNRDDYKTLDDFMPQVAKFFDDYATAFEAKMARAPKVVAMIPGNGSTDVDPATTKIVVTFDRPMRDKSWSVMKTDNNFPKITGKVSYDRARKVFTMPVKLEPGQNYEFWLNRGGNRSFQSAEGVPLRPVRVTFRTRSR